MQTVKVQISLHILTFSVRKYPGEYSAQFHILTEILHSTTNVSKVSQRRGSSRANFYDGVDTW